MKKKRGPKPKHPASEMTTIAVRVTKSVKRELERIARSQGMSVSEVVREALLTWAAPIEP